MKRRLIQDDPMMLRLDPLRSMQQREQTAARRRGRLV
jgi:hypothetical protein